jgi:Gluconate 2-dehydrogenase subunit 3
MMKPTTGNEEVTRRQWMLILGRLAAIAGFSGIVPELAAALPGVEGPGTRALPPGLYYPSQDHLSHALGDLGTVRTIPPGSETEYVKASSRPFRPQFFEDEEFEIVTRIIELLLGKVSPGALLEGVQWLDLYLYSAAGVREAALSLDPLHRALAVAYYGESAVREFETADPQGPVRSGLTALQDLSIEQFGQGFLPLGDSEQIKLITMISSGKPESPLRKLFEILRTEAVRGYYTSAEGLKELDYKGNWYYAVCPACEQK